MFYHVCVTLLCTVFVCGYTKSDTLPPLPPPPLFLLERNSTGHPIKFDHASLICCLSVLKCMHWITSRGVATTVPVDLLSQGIIYTPWEPNCRLVGLPWFFKVSLPKKKDQPCCDLHVHVLFSGYLYVYFILKYEWGKESVCSSTDMNWRVCGSLVYYQHGMLKTHP